MTPRELAAARKLLILLHEQADRTPRLRARLPAFRVALACIEAVQAALAEEAQRVAPTQLGDYRTTLYTPAYARTELSTQLLEAA